MRRNQDSRAGGQALLALPRRAQQHLRVGAQACLRAPPQVSSRSQVVSRLAHGLHRRVLQHDKGECRQALLGQVGLTHQKAHQQALGRQGGCMSAGTTDISGIGTRQLENGNSTATTSERLRTGIKAFMRDPTFESQGIAMRRQAGTDNLALALISARSKKGDVLVREGEGRGRGRGRGTEGG